ncbi:uncharacterized protein DMAD_11788 [Drosophila madeirensis]|uniref:Uncharacterized protein n=1 Tax=Drosophila madeirensis TaxID=30013 RepID=A0AAU9FEC6_DROMD
MDGKNLYIA